MRNGIYKVDYQTLTGSGWGLAHLQDGKVWGGDHAIVYTGTYSESRGVLTVRVKGRQYAEMLPGSESLFGRTDNDVQLEGACTETTAELEGRSRQASGIPIKISISWLAD